MLFTQLLKFLYSIQAIIPSVWLFMLHYLLRGFLISPPIPSILDNSKNTQMKFVETERCLTLEQMTGVLLLHFAFNDQRFYSRIFS